MNSVFVYRAIDEVDFLRTPRSPHESKMLQEQKLDCISFATGSNLETKH